MESHRELRRHTLALREDVAVAKDDFVFDADNFDEGSKKSDGNAYNDLPQHIKEK